MPAIRGVYGLRPSDGAPGVWLELSHGPIGVYVGVPLATLTVLVPVAPNAVNAATFATQAASAITAAVVAADAVGGGQLTITVRVQSLVPFRYGVVVQ